MDGFDQVLAYAAADFSLGDQQMIQCIKKLIGISSPLPDNPLIIDLGCGPGNITLKLAQLFPMARVVGIDGSLPMLSIASQRAVDQSLSVEFLCSILQNVPSYQADLLVSNSLLHHMHDPDLIWSITKRLSAPGCRVVHRDLRRPSSFQELNYLKHTYMNDLPSVLVHDFCASLLAAFTPQEIKEHLLRFGFTQLSANSENDRYLVVQGLIE